MKHKLNFLKYIAVILVIGVIFAISFLYSNGNSSKMLKNNLNIVNQNLNYDVPESAPNIIISSIGYEINDDKQIIFKGERIPDDFRIIDSKTDEVVYVGKIEKPNEIKLHSMGEFDQFSQKGEYYIEADYIGQSYPFIIDEEIKKQLYRDSYFATIESVKSNEDIYSKLTELTVLLSAYEFYPDTFTDDTGINTSGNQISDLLDIVREEINIICKNQTYNENEVLLAGVLAKFGYLYKEHDATYSNECVLLAEKLFDKNIVNMDADSDVAYLTACELYRYSKKNNYTNIINKYIKTRTDSRTNIELLGDLTYLCTSGQVDINYCEYLMDLYVKRARKNVDNAKLCSKTDVKVDIELEDVLYDTLEIVIMEYVLSSREYNDSILSKIQYIAGLNIDGYSILEAAKKSPVFTFIMCDVIIEH